MASLNVCQADDVTTRHINLFPANKLHLHIEHALAGKFQSFESYSDVLNTITHSQDFGGVAEYNLHPLRLKS